MHDMQRTPRETLIFLHIPKSGGTTLHGIIESQYPSQAILTIDGAHVQASIAEFKALPEAERARLQVLKGHMPFGLHEWLPQSSTYITLLRNPVERAISHYYHIVRTPHHTHHAAVAGTGMDLATFVREGVSRIIDNGQVRLLAAREEMPYGQCSASMLEQAKSNVERYFRVVGFTERFDETLVLLNQEFGWGVNYYHRRNVGKNRPQTASVPDETLRLIAELNEYDLQLYRFATERMDAAVRAHGPAFAAAYRWFVFSLSMRQRYVGLRHRGAGK